MGIGGAFRYEIPGLLTFRPLDSATFCCNEPVYPVRHLSGTRAQAHLTGDAPMPWRNLCGARDDDRKAPIGVERADLEARDRRGGCRRTGARVGGRQAEIDFQRRRAAETRVRFVRGIVGERGLESGGEIGTRQGWAALYRHEHLHCPPEALDACRGARRADGAEPMPNAESAQCLRKQTRGELCAAIRDEIPRRADTCDGA